MMNEEKPDPKDFPVLLDLYNRFEPYHYFTIYLECFSRMKEDKDRLKVHLEMFKNPEEWLTQNNFTQLGDLGFNSEFSKIVQLDEDLIPLLEDTVPDFKDLHLPYPAMFINHQFNVGVFRINGFLLMDIPAFRDMGFEITERTDYPSGIRILAVVLNLEGEYEFYSIEPLQDWDIAEAERHLYFDSQVEKKDMTKAANLIAKIGANLINLLINDEKQIEKVNITFTDEQNKKRMKRGKMPHRNKLVLRLGGTLKKYAQAYRVTRGEITVRFLVRGHWMRFEHPRYVNKQGTKKWVFPFYKGENNATEIHNRLIEIKK